MFDEKNNPIMKDPVFESLLKTGKPSPPLQVAMILNFAHAICHVAADESLQTKDEIVDKMFSALMSMEVDLIAEPGGRDVISAIHDMAEEEYSDFHARMVKVAFKNAQPGDIEQALSRIMKMAKEKS